MAKHIRNKNGIWINTNVFRSAAIHFEKYGYYNADPEGSPDWFRYWERERKRCLEGLTVGDASITGDHYFYLNYCPIKRVEDTNKKTSSKIRAFPFFWDGDYNYFWVREIARRGIFEILKVPSKDREYILNLPKNDRDLKLFSLLKKINLDVKILADGLLGGYDLIIGKARRKGYSFKNAAIGANNYFHRPDSYTMYMAYEKKYLYPSGIMTMALNYISFINENTAWRMPSDVVDKQDHKRASYLEYISGVKVEKGFKSELQAITFKDNPDAGRGKDAYDIIGEEVGAWGVPGGLKATLSAMKPSVEAGSIKTGMITLFGCVCKGTKVYLPNGAVCNIEDITKQTGILGYGAKGVIGENVIYLQPPKKKECVRIETIGGNFIECSTDHPLLWSTGKYRKEGKNGKKVTFKRAIDIKVGDQLMMLQQVPIFGKNKMPYARLIGLLIGDGYYGNKSTPELIISDMGIYNYLISTGLEYTIYKEKGSIKKIGIKNFQDILRGLGIYGQTKKNKRLPKKLYDYDMKSLSELLGGYFDADGNVNLYKKKNTISIRLVSVVKPLLLEVQEGLKRFGILSQIIKRNHNKPRNIINAFTSKISIVNTNISYSLEITDRESLKNFKKYISFTDSKKKKRLEDFNHNIRGYQTKDFHYEKTVKGEYFLNKKLDYLVPRFIKKITFIGKKDIYNLSTELSHTYITNGFISHNTSGDVSGGTADFASLFDRPLANGFLPFNDIWGKFEDKVEGFFHPVQWNMEGFFDTKGNSDLEKAKQSELDKREHLKENGATTEEIQLRMQEFPTDSSEAFGIISDNDFPVVELKDQLNKVKALNLQLTKGTPVKLYYESDVCKAKPILNGSENPITSYTDLPLDKKGCPIIYEYPVDNAPKGLYKIGYDPVRQDSGSSLVGIIVYKGVHTGSLYHDIIVAEYIGRKETPDENDKVAEMFADLYNTTIMYENEVTGVKNYFRRIKRLHLLALQPDKVISKNIKQSKVARVFGCHMNEQLKTAGERYVKTWLLTVLDYDENGDAIRVIDRIYSIRLLEELISYHRKGNFDLVSALFMCMFQVQEEALGKEYGDRGGNNKFNTLKNMIPKMYQKNSYNLAYKMG